MNVQGVDRTIIVSPTREEVRAWFTQRRNACRYIGDKPVVDVVLEAVAVMLGEKPIEDTPLKTPKDGRIWSSKCPRPTADQKVAGMLKFGQDLGLEMPGDGMVDPVPLGTSVDWRFTTNDASTKLKRLYSKV